jgi:hypothetical protein
MDTLEITTTAQEHPCPAGTKTVVITDGTQNHGHIDFELDATEDSPVIQFGKNIFPVPEGRDSFSVIAVAPYTVGVEYLKKIVAPGSGAEDIQTQLDDHEARITALELAGAPATTAKQKPSHTPQAQHRPHNVVGHQPPRNK